MVRVSPGPVLLVLTAMRAGAHRPADIAQRTGLRNDVVRAAVDHLVRAGIVERPVLASGCPATGCGGCGARGCANRE